MSSSSTGGGGGATPMAARLGRLMQRQGLTAEAVATQLGWDPEQLRRYLQPTPSSSAAAAATAPTSTQTQPSRGAMGAKTAASRSQHPQHPKKQQQPPQPPPVPTTETETTMTASDMDAAVEKLVVRQELALAADVAKRSATKALGPSALTMRRAHAAPQLARYMTDRRGVLQAASTPVASPSATESRATSSVDTGRGANHSGKKRRRKVFVKPLSAFSTERSHRVRPASDALCPVRIDVDIDGLRYQDNLLIHGATSTESADSMATRIAQDEQLSDHLRDAIAESIKRQLLTFSSFVSTDSESLHPVYLDLVIDGVALRDQFEWDIHCDLNDAESFAETMCSDLNLPRAFVAAIAFSIREQVYAYRRIVHSRRWIGNDPILHKNGNTHPVLGIATLEGVGDSAIRDASEVALWQPAVSELGRDEIQYLTTRINSQRRSTTTKKPMQAHHLNGKQPKRAFKLNKENKAPRPINPFIMYCQLQKELFHSSKMRRSAAESRKILGDMWRKMTDEEKEYYAQLTEVENEKRRRDHIFEIRDRAIAEWEEDEALRTGLLTSSVIDAATDHIRGLLLSSYINERHEVDSRRAPEADEGDELMDEDEEE